MDGRGLGEDESFVLVVISLNYETGFFDVVVFNLVYEATVEYSCCVGDGRRVDKFEDAFLKETLELLFAGLEKLSRAAVFCLNNLPEKYLRGGREEYLIKFGYSVARRSTAFSDAVY